MRQILILILSILGTGCFQDKENWKHEDWIPVMVDERNNKYWDHLSGSRDTLHLGEIFIAKLHMPLKEYKDSVGNRIDVRIKWIDFDVSADSVKLKFKNYIKITNDTGYLRIPVDTLMNKFNRNNLTWEASLWISNDTTYIISGDWHLSR